MFRPAIVIPLLLVLIAGASHIVFGEGLIARFGTRPAPTLVRSDFSVELSERGSIQAISDGSGFFILRSTNVTRFDNSGRQLWAQPISYTNPTFVRGGSYVGVSEYRGRTFHVFGPGGLMYAINFENDILSFHVASNGYSAVMTHIGGSYNITVFNAAGSSIKLRIIEEGGLFPVSMAISPDGRILAVSYLNTAGAVISSYICVYCIEAFDAAAGTDGLFALFRQLEGEIIYKVAFIDDSRLMYSSDREFGVYGLAPAGRVRHLWSEAFDNHAVFLEAVKNVGIAVAFGPPLISREGFEEGRFILYSPDGAELASFMMDGRITRMSIGPEAVIIGGGPLGRSFAAITYRNRVAWEYTATSDVLSFVTLDRPQRALLVTPARMEIMETR